MSTDISLTALTQNNIVDNFIYNLEDRILEAEDALFEFEIEDIAPIDAVMVSSYNRRNYLSHVTAYGDTEKWYPLTGVLNIAGENISHTDQLIGDKEELFHKACAEFEKELESAYDFIVHNRISRVAINHDPEFGDTIIFVCFD